MFSNLMLSNLFPQRFTDTICCAQSSHLSKLKHGLCHLIHAFMLSWYSSGEQFGSERYNDVTMTMMASQITGVSSVCLTVGWGVDQRKHQIPASLAFVRGIHRWTVNSPHKRPVTQKMFPFDDVILINFYEIWFLSSSVVSVSTPGLR